MRKSNIALLSLIMATQVWARGGDREQWMAVSQGISSPSLSTPVNWSGGYVYSNSTVASQYNGAQGSLEYDHNDSSDDNGMGVELGIGTGQVGLAVGYYKRDCDNCDGNTGVLGAYNFGSFSLGLGHREDTNSLGLMFDLGGSHRIGIAYDNFDDGNSANAAKSYGLGYSYQGSGFVFAVDASKRQDESNTTNDDLILVSPGLLVEVSQIALSVTYNTYLNDDTNQQDDETWFGLGYKSSSWSLGVYSEYVGDWSINFTYHF